MARRKATTTTTNATANGVTRDQLSRFEDLVGNVVMSRSQLIRGMLDPRRDIAAECGHPTDGEIQVKDYRKLYDRNPIARRAIQVWPKECWQVSPTIYEDEDSDTVTEFEEAVDQLGQDLHGEKSWHRTEEGSPLWDYMKRLDILSGIGSFGIMLLGLKDGKRFDEPAGYVKGQKLSYLRVFDESAVQITQYESRRNNKRYGKPLIYQITLHDPMEYHAGAGIGLESTTIDVHWTRVIHVADNGGDNSEIFATPRAKPILNNLIDLYKLYGGSAEMYWRGAFPGWSLETHPQLGGEVPVDKTGLRDMMEDYAHGLQRYLALIGMSAKSLAPQVVDPTPQIKVHLEAIAIQLAMPMRVFMGSERGELSSAQDDASWNDRVRERELGHCNSNIIFPFIDRCISLGVLPEPKDYTTDWPDIASQDDNTKATIAVAKTTAITTYAQSGGEQVMAKMDYWTRVMGYTEDEAQAIIDNNEEAMVEIEEHELEKQKTAIEEGIVPDPTKPPPIKPNGKVPPPNGKPQAAGAKPAFSRNSLKGKPKSRKGHKKSKVHSRY